MWLDLFYFFLVILNRSLHATHKISLRHLLEEYLKDFIGLLFPRQPLGKWQSCYKVTEIRIIILFTDEAFIRYVYIEIRGRIGERDLTSNLSRLRI